MNIQDFFSAMENVSIALDNKHVITRGTDKLYPVYIILYAHNSIVGRNIRRFTHQPYSHSAVSFNSDMNNIYSFGNRMILDKDGIYHRKFGAGRESFTKKDGKWSYPETTPYAIYCIFLPKDSIDKMKKHIHTIYNNPESYRFSYDGLIKYYLNISSESTYKMFCSQFVASLLVIGGVNLDRLPSLYSPYELKDIQDVTLVEEGILKDFNRKKFSKRMDEICEDRKKIPVE